MKRLTDIILSLVALIIMSPLLIPVIIILKLTGEHYIFYRHKRIGFWGKPFGLFKFATMLKDSPNIGSGDITIKNDPRVLPFGRFLRKSKINELPQIINVLKGDMTVIGPRPLTERNYNYYSDEIKEVIKKVRPGLSGVGSIVFRDEEKVINMSKIGPKECYKNLIAPYKGELEFWYIQHQSLNLDLLLIMITVWVVIFPKSRLYQKLLVDIPHPHSSVLARCLDLPLMAEMEKPKLAEVLNTE